MYIFIYIYIERERRERVEERWTIRRSSSIIRSSRSFSQHPRWARWSIDVCQSRENCLGKRTFAIWMGEAKREKWTARIFVCQCQLTSRCTDECVCVYSNLIKMIEKVFYDFCFIRQKVRWCTHSTPRRERERRGSTSGHDPFAVLSIHVDMEQWHWSIEKERDFVCYEPRLISILD